MLTISSLSLGAFLASARAAHRAARLRSWAAFAMLAAITAATAAGSMPVISMIVASGWGLRAVDAALAILFAFLGFAFMVVLGDCYAEEIRDGKREASGRGSRVVSSSAR